MKNIVQYIAEHYLEDLSENGLSRATTIVNFPGVHTITLPSVDGVAAYIKMSDHSLDLLERFTSEDQLTRPFLISLINEEGPNVLIFLVGTKGFTTLRKGFRALIKKEHPDTIAWFDPKTFQLHKYKVNLCQKV